MNVTMIAKELREHVRAFAVLFGFQSLALFSAIAGERTRNTAISVLDVLRMHILVFIPLASAWLGYELLTKEYRSKTVLFLEALPTSRAAVIAAKVLVGWIAVTVMTSYACVVLVEVARVSEPVDLRFFLILAGRCYGFALAVFGFFFLTGVLGRYKIPAYLALVVVAYTVDSAGREIETLALFRLLGEQFAVERELFPASAFAWALGIFAVQIALVFAIALLREGSIAVLLGEKMSHQEKVFVSGALLAALFAVGVIVDDKKKQPYALTGEGVLKKSADGVTLQVTGGSQLLLDAQYQKLAELREYFSFTELPPVFLVHRGDLDSDRFEDGEIHEREGVLVRANLRSDPGAELTAHLIMRVLEAKLNRRNLLEPRLWLTLGFAQWFAARGPHETERRQILRLRALYAARHGVDPGDLDRIWSLDERFGESLTDALAWSAIEVLLEASGEEKAGALFRAALGTEVPRDWRALVHEREFSIEQLLPREAGITKNDLLARWKEYLHREAEKRKSELEFLPALDGKLEIVETSKTSRRVEYGLKITPEPPEGTRFAIVYAKLGPLELFPLEHNALDRIDRDYALDAKGYLPTAFNRGARIYLAFAMRIPALDCEVRANSTRVVLE